MLDKWGRGLYLWLSLFSICCCLKSHSHKTTVYSNGTSHCFSVLLSRFHFFWRLSILLHCPFQIMRLPGRKEEVLTGILYCMLACVSEECMSNAQTHFTKKPLRGPHFRTKDYAILCTPTHQPYLLSVFNLKPEYPYGNHLRELTIIKSTLNCWSSKAKIMRFFCACTCHYGTKNMSVRKYLS